MVGKEHKDEDKKVVVPPVNNVLSPPADHVEIQLELPPPIHLKLPVVLSAQTSI